MDLAMIVPGSMRNRIAINALQQSSLNRKMKTNTNTTLHLGKLISRSPLRRGLLLIALTSVCFALSATARAQLPSPTPDGGYPSQNTAEGTNALFSLTTGHDNTAIGFSALDSNTTGEYNTAVGSDALKNDTFGFINTAIGSGALQNNISGNFNTAIGCVALVGNTTGNNNTAEGYLALGSNRTGLNNTANGFEALYSNQSGTSNTATGFKALYNSTGNGSTATGYQALLKNTTGSNTAAGAHVLQNNTTGTQNTASGVNALLLNKIGNGNTAEGQGALQNSVGSFNTALGFNAGANLTTGSDNIDIDAGGVAGESGTIRIGVPSKQLATYVAGIYGATVATGVQVIVAPNGQLGTVQSSARYKDDIKPMDKASEALFKLKPVTFRYKQELDPEKIPQFGLIAEEVEKINPNLIARDEKGEIYTVRYEAVNVMLLNEFLKEHRKVEEQQATITRLESKVAKQELTATQQQQQIETLTATVRKVSDQVALSKPAPQVVAND